MTTWNLLRAAGIGSYLMLFASVAWGLFGTTTLWGRLAAKASATAIHQFFSTVGMVLLVAHLALLYVDPWMPFDLGELFIPGRSEYRPLGVGLGVVAMYLSAIVIASSWVRKGIGPRVWRTLHLLSIPMFSLMMLHGILAGTDTERPWMWGMYLATATAIVFLLVLRALTARPPRQAAGNRAATTVRPGADAISSVPPADSASPRAIASPSPDPEARTPAPR